jgi:hypothetical protein
VHRYAALSWCVALLCAACHKGKPESVAPRAVRFDPRDPRRCVPPPDAAPGDRAVVRACAEAFVLHNGYTPTPAPRDTSLLVRESFEIGSWSLLTNQRRYTIESKAVRVACTARVCTVFFLRFDRRFGCGAVKMTAQYDQLHFGRPDTRELVGPRQGC